MAAFYVFGIAWLTGATVTWIRLGNVSSDSLETRAIISLFFWPFFWIGWWRANLVRNAGCARMSLARTGRPMKAGHVRHPRKQTCGGSGILPAKGWISARASKIFRAAGLIGFPRRASSNWRENKMALITDFCPACNQLRPCACSVKMEFTPSPQAEPKPENVVSLGARRFSASTSTEESNPRDVLEKALADFDDPNTPTPDHIIICIGRDPEDGGSATTWLQAGSYRYHAQIGLLHEAAQMIRDNG